MTTQDTIEDRLRAVLGFYAGGRHIDLLDHLPSPSDVAADAATRRDPLLTLLIDAATAAKDGQEFADRLQLASDEIDLVLQHVYETAPSIGR